MIWTLGCIAAMILSVGLYHELRRSRNAHRDASIAMGRRSRTVDRLLDFAQTIQGAGKPEQIFDSLTLYLHGELELTGVVILAHDPESLPAITLKSTCPASIVRTNCSIAEMETSLCPCL